MAKSSAKSLALSALDYLAHPEKHPAASVCAVHGPEEFLKREVLQAIRREVLGEEGDEFSLVTFSGDEAELRDVVDALSTASLFGSGRRLVIVEAADAFVSARRGELEAYVAKPVNKSVLVLEVKTWPANTRLAKAVAKDGLSIECKPPGEARVKRWLSDRAKSEHDVRLDATAADALVEMLPPELGILDQELTKLALLAGKDGVIDHRLVQEHAGDWRLRTTWDMMDSACDGRAPEALKQLDKLLAAGESPQGLLPQMSYSLRQFAAAVQLIETSEEAGQRLPLRTALGQAGVPPFKLADAERQLRQIGRLRAGRLSGLLLAADLAVKGHNSAPAKARMELERLIVRLSSAAGEHRSASGGGAVGLAATGAQ
jgi:DNA polymerase-3 subunit delta